MFKALNKFQEYLKAHKEINNNEVVRYRNSLDELKYYRDQIIHKGAIIDDLKSKHLVEDVIKFASIYSTIIFNKDI
jgi:SPX domain protein involved in polyphosphate accumulation